MTLSEFTRSTLISDVKWAYEQGSLSFDTARQLIELINERGDRH